MMQHIRGVNALFRLMLFRRYRRRREFDNERGIKSLLASGYLETEFDAVPSTLCLFFTVGNQELIEGNSPAGRQKLAFCFGQTYIDNFGLTATSANGRSPTLTTHEVVSATESLQKTSVGPTYGVAITDHVSLGASLHGTLTTRRAQWRATSISADGGGKAITSGLLDDVVGTSFEITSLIGATYRAAPVTLGLAISLPAIHLYGTSNLATASQLTGTGTGGPTDSVDATGTFSATPPVRIDFGAGFETAKTTMELDLGVSLPKDAAFETVLQGSHSSVLAGSVTTQPFSGDYVSPARAAVRGETLGDRIGERMRSRLHEMCRILTLDGTDFRQKFRSANFR